MMVNKQDLAQVASLLSNCMSGDNTLRKQSEDKLRQAKNSDANKYAVIMSAVLDPANNCNDQNIRKMAAIILRNDIKVVYGEAQDGEDGEDRAGSLWSVFDD